ncbi:MAG: ATP-binding protein [Candidatus Dormibacteria bacterium]
MQDAYRRRVVDDELDELATGLPAIALEGAKGVGKTTTATVRARTVHSLDVPAQLQLARGEPARLLSGDRPVLIDEWQRLPETWDLVRRAVDAGAAPGSFLLAGSASPKALGTHSGAGRIVTLRMRPLSLAERLDAPPTVSLVALLSGRRERLDGSSDLTLEGYTHEILRSGLPGLRHLQGRQRDAQLDGYIRRVIDRDLPELGHQVRNPVGLLAWLRAYAAATSTTASFELIRDAATAGHDEKPARATVAGFRDGLERLWLIEPVPAWQPRGNRIRLLGRPPKHQLVDPALVAQLLGVDAGQLLSGVDVDPRIPRDGLLLGALFESVVTLAVRVYAQAAQASVFHLRTRGGEHEVDLIVERRDGRVVALEVKLAQAVDDRDVRHLRWLQATLGDRLLDAVVISTGTAAYRRQDGIAVIPAALLGP